MNKQDKLKELRDERDKINNEISKLNKDIRKEMFENKDYITDLSPYDGMDLYFITPIDSNGEDVYIPTDEFIEVRDNRLYVSSYSGGIVQWVESEQAYYHFYHYSQEKLDIVGFTDIQLPRQP